jgi:hypothetical protein
MPTTDSRRPDFGDKWRQHRQDLIPTDQVGLKRGFGADRLAYPVGLDRAVVYAAGDAMEILAVFAEMGLQERRSLLSQVEPSVNA